MNETIKNINNYIRHNLSFTVRLNCLNENKLPTNGRASGFIYLSPNNKHLLITASHILIDCNSWLIETTYIQNNHTLLLKLGEYTLLNKVSIHNTVIKPIDLLIYELDLSKYKDVIDKADLVFYRGSIDNKPQIGEAYGFASWSRVEFDANIDKLMVDSAIEIGMEYIEEMNDIYSFKLESKHKGHDYYYGSSGSPISDSTGKVVSIVLSGDETNNIIYGLALNNFSVIINAL